MAIYKLGDIYMVKPQYGVGAKALEQGNFQYVRQTDIRYKKFDTFVNEGPLLKNGDFLISRVGVNAGETYYHTLGNNFVFAGFLVRYKFNKKLVNTKYLYLWSKTNIYIKQMLNLRTGAVQPNFNPESVKALKIDLPSLGIQQQIIDIIEPIERIVNVSNNISQNIMDICKNLYYISSKQQIFIDKIATVHLGGTPSTKDENFWGGDIPWINSGSLTNTLISKKQDNFITQKAVSKTYIASEYQLLFSIMEPKKNKVCISSQTQGINQSTVAIESNKNLYFEILDVMDVFNLIKSGSAQQSINKNDILKTKINLSKINFDNQLKFVKKLGDISLKMINLKNKIIKLLIK